MKIDNNGRSMIEMLGVLAIVGILTLGGIQGFSKAMTKHKLNQQTEQFSILFNAMDTYFRKLTDAGSFYNLIPVFKAMGEIPDGLTEKNGQLFDQFGNKINIGTNDCPAGQPCQGTAMSYVLKEKSNFAICNNLIQLAKGHADNLDRLLIAYVSSENPTTYDYIYQGNKRCSNTAKCIRNITINDTTAICLSCEEKEDCRITFCWNKRS